MVGSSVQRVVALDGPAGAGKSSVAIALARRLGLSYVETGAIYRAVAFVAGQRGVSLDDAVGLATIAAELEIRFEMKGEVNQVWLNGSEVTASLRANEISLGASRVSAHPAVRAALLELQRKLGRQGAGSVLEGRDIGTVVFPDSKYKFFVTASAEARAQRRFLQLQAEGREVPFEQLVADIMKRDEMDSTRAVAPLRPAPDAVVVDTTGMNLGQVVEHIARLVEESCE